MNHIKSEDLKMGESKNPIEALLQQTGWSLEEALLRLSSYKSSTIASDSTSSNIKSDVKTEVKEEISDYYKFFMSVNKREEENDSDVEVIDEYTENDVKSNTIVKESKPAIEIIDDTEENLTNESAVIDTISISNKSENSCQLLKDDTKNFKQIYTKVKNKLNIKNISLKRKKQLILKKYRSLRILRIKREIEKTEKKAAEVRKRIKLQLELLRKKKKPSLKFSCSQPEIDVEIPLENLTVEQNKSVIDDVAEVSTECNDVLEKVDGDLKFVDDGKVSTECNDVLEMGDSDLMIVDVVGGYQSPVREEIDYLEDFPNDMDKKDLISSENVTLCNKNQLPEEAVTCNTKNQSEMTSKLKMCEYIKKLIDNEMEVPLNSNTEHSTSRETRLSEDEESNSSIQSKTTTKLKICENIKQSLEYEKKDSPDKNFESMKSDETLSTGNFLRSLSENIFSKPIISAITPTKTKDITKIKGWKNKHFVESEEKTSTVNKESSFLKLQEESILHDTSAFVSTQLDQFLNDTPKSYHSAKEFQEPQGTSEPVIISTDNVTMPNISAVFTKSNNVEDSTFSNTPTTTTILTNTSPISTVSPEFNDIASSSAFNTPVISTNSIISRQTESLTDSNTSTVSTNLTFSSLPVSATNSASVLTNTNVPSTFGASVKPYKPKTLAEKRRLLEESKLPLTAQSILSMTRKQRQENCHRFLNYWNQIVNGKEPFDRKSYKISSQITSMYSYIVCNGKRLKVTSSKNDRILANIKNRRKMSKINHFQLCSETSQLNKMNKPSLLKSLKKPHTSVKLDFKQWETVEVKLPKIYLTVVPQYGQSLDPNVEHFIQNDTWCLSEKRVKFALSLLRTKNVKPKLHTFRFPLAYENNQQTMKMKRKICDVKTEDIKTESDDEIQQGVKSVMDKLLNYVDVLDETKYLNNNFEKVESNTNEPILTASKVGRPLKRHSGPRSKINKTALEMKRLNCQIVSVVNDEENTETENCTKEICKLGCICKTLRCDSKNLLPVHCGSWKCIFKCSCKNNSNIDSTSMPSGYNLLNAGVINRLQDQAKKNLAKVEKEFTQTIIKTSNQLIMVGDCKERRRRVTKTPKKYNDYLNDDLGDNIENDNRQSSTDDEVLLTLSDDIKPCSVPLTKYNLKDIIPFCMIHSMYKCACLYKSDCGITALQSAASNISRCSEVPASQKPELLQTNTEKIRKRYKAAPRSDDGFVKPQLKYTKKQKKDKTFNKEEFCSRTRGLPSPYYIPRNTAETHLDKMLKSSKKFCRDLKFYIRNLRAKLNELRHTSEYTDLRAARQEEMERELLRQTIDRLSPFLTAELHLDYLISRLYQRMKGILTPETMRRIRPSESQSEISQDTPKETDLSNNLNAVVNCSKPNTNNTGNKQPASPGPINIKEKYMSSKNRELRLLPWTSLQNNYSKGNIEIWYLNTTKISPIIITQRNRRPSVNHCNIKVFEHIQEETSIPLDFIRCIVRKEVPLNKNPENIFVILAFNENRCSELYSVCERTFSNDNGNDKIEVAIIQQIREHSILKGIDIEGLSKEVQGTALEESEEEEEELQGEFHHCNIKNDENVINYFVRKFQPHILYYNNIHPSFFDTKRDVRLPLPREPIKCRWRLIYTDQNFSYLHLSRNNFSIKYCDIMNFVQLARKKRKTVILTSDKLKKHYSHKMFGIYCVPTYLDKIFLGPYLTDEDHHVEILNANNETMMLDITNGLWVTQIENHNDCDNSTDITESCIDLTEEVDLRSILKNWNCNNLLEWCYSSKSVQNDDEFAINYEEDAYWNDLNLLMKDVDFGKPYNKIDNQVIEKHYYSMKNKSSMRYFVTNVSGLGYIKAYAHEDTNVVDILCPLTNQIRRFPNCASAVYGIARILIQNIILIPFNINSLKIKMMAKLNPTMKTPLSTAVLDGYHIAGSCGVKNIRESNKEELQKLGLTEYEIEVVIVQRTKRRIYDLTDQLAQMFLLEGASAQRSYGDVLTEVIKKIFSTMKLNTVGSSLKNIEKSMQLINSYPTSVKTRIYKQLEYIAFKLKKEKLSTSELQNIRKSPQKEKSTTPISPIISPSASTSNVSDKDMPGYQKIRLFPQTEKSFNLETQKDPSSSNVGFGELSNSKFQRIKFLQAESSLKCRPDIELKPITCKGIKFKEIRRSLPNEKFTISTSHNKANLNANDVIITKLNRLQCFGTTVVANKEKKKDTLIDDDVIVIEPEPTPVQKTKPTSLLRNQKQPGLKKRSLQLEDNVVIQPQPKRLRMNVQNDVIIQPELKNHITQRSNGTIQSPSKKSIVQNNIVVDPKTSATHKRLQVLLANGNTTSLLKGKYINLLPLKGDGGNKYVILPNKDNSRPLRQNIDAVKFKKVPNIQNGKKVLLTSQNGKSLLVPQSTNVTGIAKLAKTSVQLSPVNKLNKQCVINVPVKKTKVSIPRITPISDMILAKQSPKLSTFKKLGIRDDKSSSSFITIQSVESTQSFKGLNKNKDSVKNIITGEVVSPAHDLTK